MDKGYLLHVSTTLVPITKSYEFYEAKYINYEVKACEGANCPFGFIFFLGSGLIFFSIYDVEARYNVSLTLTQQWLPPTA